MSRVVLDITMSLHGFVTALIAQQALHPELVDELQIHVAPVILGRPVGRSRL